MTDRPDEQGPDAWLHESPLDPADDARIRRLLAEARHTDPIPAAVAARLDDVLGDLVADRAGREAHEATRVPDLAARRRRRTAANLLVAAAAVVMVGIGISQVLPEGGLGGSDGEAATAQDAGGDAGGGQELLESPDARAPSAPDPAESPAAGGSDRQAYAIRSDRFGPDVRKVRSEVLRDDADFADTDDECVDTDVGSASVVPATYDGAPAALVLRLPSGDVQVVDLYLCGDQVPRRSITLTAP
jgi:hypothetical protein